MIEILYSCIQFSDHFNLQMKYYCYCDYPRRKKIPKIPNQLEKYVVVVVWDIILTRS